MLTCSSPAFIVGTSPVGFCVVVFMFVHALRCYSCRAQSWSWDATQGTSKYADAEKVLCEWLLAGLTMSRYDKQGHSSMPRPSADKGKAKAVRKGSPVRLPLSFEKLECFKCLNQNPKIYKLPPVI